MKRLFRSLIVSLIICFALYGALVQLGPQLLGGHAASAAKTQVAPLLLGFPLQLWLLGLGLASLNYAFRFVRWQHYLGRLGVGIPGGASLLIFLSGFALTVTPGKVGEVLKSYLIKQAFDVPVARTAPIVVAERLTDLLALLLLTLCGVLTWMGSSERWLIAIGFGLCLLCLVVISSRRLAHGSIDVAGRLLPARLRPGITGKLHEFYDATALLVRPLSLLYATALAVLSWSCECVAFYVVLRGFVGGNAQLLLCTFIYATMTVAGALAFFTPGGLGVTEGGMALLLSRLSHTTESVAVAATLIIRLVTLWFAVALGVVALLLFQRSRHVTVDLGAVKAQREAG